jgi:hypothetical protein
MFPADGEIRVAIEPESDGRWLVWFGDDGAEIDWGSTDPEATAREVLWILADKLQDQVEERFRDAWPRCPDHRRSLSADPGTGDSVWKCPDDGWTCPIGELI